MSITSSTRLTSVFRAPAPHARLAFLCALFLVSSVGSALAVAPRLAIRPTGKGGVVLQGENLNRVVEAEVRIDYQSASDAPPKVTAAGARADMTVENGTAGSITLRFRSKSPMSGHVQLATAQMEGAITFLSAWVRDDMGATESPDVSITNPTDEELAALARKRQTTAPPVPPATADPVPAATASPVPEPKAPPVAAPLEHSPAPSVSRRPSVRHLFSTFTGDRSAEAMIALFRRGDDIFSQEPPVLLSDGRAALRLTVRTAGEPRFAIFNGNCTGVSAGHDGTWALDIVPVKGALDASVTVFSGEDVVEFPLAVAPPLALFDPVAAGDEASAYVEAANSVAARLNEAAAAEKGVGDDQAER